METLKKLCFSKALLLLFGLMPNSLQGQFFIWGQDPGSTKWKQIHTENFQVIFPEGAEEQGKYVADLLEYSITMVARSLKHEPRKIPVIIHNQTVVSNGFVSWAPRRVELFTNPPQDNGADDWIEKLVVHELRHVVQIDKLNQGLIKILSYVLGEQATGAFFGLSIPMWFVEGDAVAVETGLTIGGRGRQPRFEQGLRAQVLEKGIYSYDKAFFGSFKDFVPNFYELGYQLVAFGRAQFGEEIWENAVSRVTQRPLTLAGSFSRGLKKNTGMGLVSFYRNAFAWLDSIWRRQKYLHQYNDIEAISPPNLLFTNYRNPNFANDTLLIALKTGLAEPPTVVAFDLQGNEEKLFSPGFVDENGLSAAAGKVVWAETRTNPRWEHLSYSEIHKFCIDEEKRKRLTRNTRLFAPSISPNGETIAAIEVNSHNQCRLVLISSESGKELNRFKIDEFSFLMTPAWHPSLEKIVLIALDENGKHLVTLDLSTGKYIVKYSAGSIDISHPSFDNSGNILFTGGFSGKDGIYVLDFNDGSINQMVSVPYGATFAVSRHNSSDLYFSNYTVGGYQIARAMFDETTRLKPVTEVQDNSTRFHEVISQQERVAVKRSQVPRTEHQVRPYSKFLSIFNLHSWAPGVLDVNNRDVKPGASLSFQNKLSTSVAVLAYEHDVNENLGKFRLGFDYYGFFPVVNLEASTGLRKATYRENDIEKEFNFRENKFTIGLSQPLQYNKYNWFYGFIPSARIAVSTIGQTKTSPDFFVGNRYFALEYRLWAYLQQRQVARDLRPRWAQVVDVNYRHTPFGGTDMGSVFSVRGATSIPGFARHHSLRLGYAYQKHLAGERVRNTINLRFPNMISYPRGIRGQWHQSVVSLSADYALPLIYPDLSLPGIFYIKRIHANLFADRTYAVPFPTEEIPSPPTVRLQSYGIDIIARLHLFRFFFPFDLGARVFYHPETRKFDANLIFEVRM